MTLNTVCNMAQSHSLIMRVAACAAELGNSTPQVWAANNILPLVATAPVSLQTAWDAANTSVNVNPDTGARDDIITDAMINAAVTALRAKQLGTQGWPTT